MAFTLLGIPRGRDDAGALIVEAAARFSRGRKNFHPLSDRSVQFVLRQSLRRLRHDPLREDYIVAAVAVLARCGFDAKTVAELVRRTRAEAM